MKLKYNKLINFHCPFFEDLDECATNSDHCDVNAACKNSVGSYTCKCKSGYTGDGKICNGKERNIKPPSQCHLSYFCLLRLSWWRRWMMMAIMLTHMFSQTNLDVEECTANSHSCGINAMCNNTPGSYTCACKAGYSGDGKTCTGELSINSPLKRLKIYLYNKIFQLVNFSIYIYIYLFNSPVF